MKIVIGITRNPEKIPDIVFQYQGKANSATEVGPFLSREEALAWLECLKSQIGHIEEIPCKSGVAAEEIYYGFTFERAG